MCTGVSGLSQASPAKNGKETEETGTEEIWHQGLAQTVSKVRDSGSHSQVGLRVRIRVSTVVVRTRLAVLSFGDTTFREDMPILQPVLLV